MLRLKAKFRNPTKVTVKTDPKPVLSVWHMKKYEYDNVVKSGFKYNGENIIITDLNDQHASTLPENREWLDKKMRANEQVRN